ncbi:MAG: VWA domain-containing protein [Pirellulales bacterium]|nr:VWA domain-containing protein [Pirellulales bacterium]
MFNVSLEQGYSATTMLAVAAAAVVLTATFYRRTFGALPGRQWLALLVLRSVAILVVVLLLFRPVFSYHRDIERRRQLVFLLDSSSSMSISDDATGVTRFNQARQLVQRWWEKLRGDLDLRLIEFSEQARPLDDVERLAGLRPDGKATSLAAALQAARKVAQPGDVEAVILFSDGVHNSAGEPLEAAQQMGMVVHAVGVGASLRSDAAYRDIQVTGIDCPDQLLLDNVAKITASVEAVGLAGRVVRVILEEDEQQLDEVELTLDSVEGSQPVEFEFRPATAGRHTYSIVVPPVGEERIEENNRRSAVALVIEPGIRVLYLEGTIRAEYGALVQRFLAKDPDLEFCALVQTRPNVFLKRSNIDGLQLEAIPADAEAVNSFDVFLLGDLDASYIRPAQQELFVRRIRDGAGLVMLGGYHSLGPGGYAGTPLGEILPVQLGGREVGQITEPFLPVLTPEGTRHPIFANIAGFFPTQQGEPQTAGLPPLDGCTRVGPARPGATVLATFPDASGPMAVLAVQPVDRGRTAVFCGDTTRRWQQGPRAADRKSPFLRFWGQLIRWAAGRSEAVEPGASVAGSTDKGYYEPQEPIHITAVVRDQDGEGTDGAKVAANVRGPKGRPDQVVLSVAVGPGGHYAGTFEPATAGAYEITVEAKIGDQTLTAEKMVVEVGRPNLEFERLDLDDKMLAQIASDTGGRYVHVTTADYLVEQLDRSQQNRREYLTVQLYWPPLLWLVFVGVLTAEWILRRRFQLR